MRRNMVLISGRKLLLIPTILITLAAVATAQSGRRGPKKSPTPASQPAPPLTEVQSNPQRAARIRLLIAVNEASAFERVPLGVADTVLEACVQRLAEARTLIASVAPRRMTRGDAVKAAKAETTRYVVWLEIGNERDDFGADVSSRDQFYINYTIFEPTTAKIKQTGRAHQGTARIGNVGVPVPSTRGAVYSDHAIRETARQAAERILDAFQIPLGGWPR